MSTTANILMPNELSSGVYLYSELMMMSAIAPFLRSKTTRMPLRSDSSRKSETPSIFFSLIKAAIFSTMAALLTAYGISRITRLS